MAAHVSRFKYTRIIRTRVIQKISYVSHYLIRN